MSYFDDAKIPVCRFLETSYVVKFFRTASELSLCFSGKIRSGISTGGFSAESLAASSTVVPGALSGSAQGLQQSDFWEAPRTALCVQALAVRFLGRAGSWPLVLPLPGEPLPLCPQLGVQPAGVRPAAPSCSLKGRSLPGWAGGFEVEFQWNYCISC